MPVGNDFDIEMMVRSQMKAEIKKLRAGIRKHRDSSGHDLCWYVPELWGLLPEKTEPNPQVPGFVSSFRIVLSIVNR